MQAAMLTDRGQVRSGNEDAVYVEPPGSQEARARGVLCIVADGMGGYAAGEVASRMAVQGVRNRYYTGSSTFIVDALQAAIEGTNREVWQAAQRQPETVGMGCTLTTAVILNDDLVLGHVGDSRAYLVRDGGITQLTRDHSWVAEQVEAGTLTPEQAHRHPQRNVILRALGARSTVEVDITRDKVLDGDIVVLCSDGLSTVVSDEEIGRIALEASPDQAVRQLVGLANKRGAPDNVTAAVLRVLGPKRHWASRLRGRWAVAVAAALLAVAATFTLAGLAHPDQAAPSPAGLTPAAELGTLAPTLAPPSTLPPSAPAAATVAPTPSAAALNRSARVIGGEANLRTTPELPRDDSNVKATLPEGERLLIIGQAQGPPAGGDTDRTWYQVEVSRLQISGWIYGRKVEWLSVAGTASPAPNELRP